MSRAKKETAASLIASGQVKVIRTPEEIYGSGYRLESVRESWKRVGGQPMGSTFGAERNQYRTCITKAQFYSDAPPKWLRPVKPPHQMSQKELDKELEAIYRRLSSSAASSGHYGHHEGLQPSEIVMGKAIAA